MTTITPPLKWHGGKQYLADRIIALMPPHVHYVEPFAGGLAVLLAKNPEGVSEVVNDINYELTNFWSALQDENAFAEFKRRLDAVPFSQVEWEGAGAELEQGRYRLDGMTGMAVAFFVRCRQSMAGRMSSFAPLSRNRTRRGMNEQASAWMTAVEGLPAVAARLKRVAILNLPAVKCIKQQDGDNTLFYLDPPYVPESRTAPKVYDHEMTFEQHEELLATIRECKGKVVLSGYDSELYSKSLHDWKRHEFTLPNNAASGAEKRRMTEVLWCNFGGAA